MIYPPSRVLQSQIGQGQPNGPNLVTQEMNHVQEPGN